MISLTSTAVPEPEVTPEVKPEVSSPIAEYEPFATSPSPEPEPLITTVVAESEPEPFNTKILPEHEPVGTSVPPEIEPETIGATLFPELENRAEPESIGADLFPEPENQAEPESIGANLFPESENRAEPEAFAELASSEELKWIVIFFYSLYILLIIASNSMIILTVKKTRKLHTASGFFIVSLSAAYICVAIFVLPVEITARFTEAWLPVLACKLCHLSSLTSSTAAIFSLMMASINRYRAIIYVSAPHLTIAQVSALHFICLTNIMS